MDENHFPNASNVRPSVAGSYLKMGFAVLVGAALGLGIYFLTAADIQASPGTTTADQVCVCPNCGMTVPKPPNVDCEELNCPSCGHALADGARLAAVAAIPEGGILMAPMTQNQRETLAEQGLAAPVPMPVTPPQAMFQQPAPQPVATMQAPTLGDELKCVCPNCGKTIDKQPGVPCEHVRCPNCGATMTNAVFVGPRQDLRLMGLTGPATPSYNDPGATAPTTAAAPLPCPQATAAFPAPCPHVGGHGGQPFGGQPSAPANPVQQATPQMTTYSNTISGIIQRNCLRCHGGPIRTLKTYDQVKAYADSGLLEMMIQPGGPMSRFLTAHESHQITDWIKVGSPP